MKLSVSHAPQRPLGPIAIGDLEYDRDDRGAPPTPRVHAPRLPLRRAAAPAPEWLARVRREYRLSAGDADALLSRARPMARRLRMPLREVWEALASGRTEVDLEQAIRNLEAWS